MFRGLPERLRQTLNRGGGREAEVRVARPGVGAPLPPPCSRCPADIVRVDAAGATRHHQVMACSSLGRRAVRCVVTVVIAALAGCAVFRGPDLRAGQSVADIQAQLGVPTGQHELAGGQTRLEFARGPFGRQTWMVSIGDDRIVRSGAFGHHPLCYRDSRTGLPR